MSVKAGTKIGTIYTLIRRKWMYICFESDCNVMYLSIIIIPCSRTRLDLYPLLLYDYIMYKTTNS